MEEQQNQNETTNVEPLHENNGGGYGQPLND